MGTGSAAFIDRVRAMVRGEPRRERRRESRLMFSVPLSRIIEVVCSYDEIDPAELGEHESRHPAGGASLSREKSRDGDQRGARSGIGAVASGKCAESDPALQ